MGINFLGVCIGFLSFFWNTSPKSYQEDFFNLAHRQAKKEYGLEVRGAGSGCKDRKIQFFHLKYYFPKHATIREARSMILKLAEEDLILLRNFEKIHPEMYSLPITLNSIDIGVRFLKSSQEQNVFENTYVCHVLLVKEEIIYSKYDSSNGDTIDFYTETVEEARAKLQEEALKQDPKGN